MLKELKNKNKRRAIRKSMAQITVPSISRNIKSSSLKSRNKDKQHSIIDEYNGYKTQNIESRLSEKDCSSRKTSKSKKKIEIYKEPKEFAKSYK